MNTEKIIIDVRTPGEFMGGHVTGSTIPLQDLERRVEEIKAMQQFVILCCASGMRSAKVTS